MLIFVLYSLKSQLTAQALNPKTGKVLLDYVKIYQNNMLMHLHAQQAQIRPLLTLAPMESDLAQP
ncbi:hypothetical protein V8B97DRAFT_1711456 [Scleroderma yunnanense]